MSLSIGAVSNGYSGSVLVNLAPQSTPPPISHSKILLSGQRNGTDTIHKKEQLKHYNYSSCFASISPQFRL